MLLTTRLDLSNPEGDASEAEDDVGLATRDTSFFSTSWQIKTRAVY